MRKTQNKRTLHDILYYIKSKAQDGILKDSINVIAGATGYSNATVHRALQALSESGMIEVIRGKTHREGQVIRYFGPKGDDINELLVKAQVAIDQLDKATDNVKGVMFQLRSMMALAEIQEFNQMEFQ